jgi:hypothetical protein
VDQKNLTPEQQKRTWEVPSIEELDFVDTSAAFINPGAADAGIYSH